MRNKLLFSLVMATSLAGCSSSPVSPDQYSGFLSNYSKLQEAKSPEGATVMRWVSPDLKPGMYSKVILVPSVLYPEPKPSAQVSATALSAITTQFDTNLKNAVKSSGMQLTTSAGPGTLRIRPAITAVNTSSAPLAAYQYIPIGLVITGVAAAAGQHDQQVALTAEMEVTDAQSGTVLGQVVRENTGTDLSNTKQQLSVTNAQPVLKTWADDLATNLKKFK